MRKLNKAVILFLFIAFQSYCQNNVEFDGQLSVFGNLSPDSELELQFGARYIPELEYQIKLDSTSNLDFQASVNLDANSAFSPFYKSREDGNIDPYRVWARYSTQQFELRAGLQKIDFGSATMLRPLQWFNQIDPRDPLALTNGVYGLLSRYYFTNNANVWAWVLYGNERTRGFDAIKTYDKRPEYGGRVQYPVPKGELALSYHHRTADPRDLFGPMQVDQIAEDKFGIDGKWDVEVGLWFEATYSLKSENIGILTNQSLMNFGIDYTFGIGNGLGIILEHLISSYDDKAFKYVNNNHISALNATYPLTMYDNISTVVYHDWASKNATFFLNYEHQFSKLTGYVMAYYNPVTQQGLQENELVNTNSGPGIRLMLVYNH
ncbi:porin family protein [Maribacter hydrothermalis]|uniref:Phosphate-selective porin O and P n=1 Tax=Maribacter hydrothermalis TaxID=1836467 RepID=A0A1B7YZ28_9FLAO|nr:hypothetical protein [Maribacter hydrothermalis]APQ16120.1 hypothetical protein BTR34_01605 [Maribacter hydrothermalis]OBR35703.1 hypothetical protein A9200_10910 [Maribacter hydrothermalis]